MLPKALLDFSVKANVVDSIYGHTASRDLRTHDKGRIKRDDNQSIGQPKEKRNRKYAEAID